MKDPGKEPEMGWSEREEEYKNGRGCSPVTFTARGVDLDEEPAKEPEMGRSEREEEYQDGSQGTSWSERVIWVRSQQMSQCWACQSGQRNTRIVPDVARRHVW